MSLDICQIVHGMYNSFVHGMYNSFVHSFVHGMYINVH